MPLNDQQIQTLGRDALQRAAAGDFASAEEMFARIVEARPNMGQALHLLGQVRLKLGRFAEAREPLERAAQFLPRDVSAQTNLAGCLIQLGQHEPALAALAKAARLKPDDAVISLNTGRALEALGRAEEAERAYDLALSIDHRLLPALSARADLLAARGEWAGALADLETALVSQPDDPRLRLRRGELMLRQGDWWRGLGDHEARLEIPGERYAPDLPRWQGEPLDGRLLLYPEQADIESDAALRDTLMLARGVDAVVQCGATLADWLDGPTVRRGEPLDGFVAAAPLRSLPLLLGWTRDVLPPPANAATRTRVLVTHRMVQRNGAPCRTRSRTHAGRDRDLPPRGRRRQLARACRRIARYPDADPAAAYRRLALGSEPRNIALVCVCRIAARR